MPKNIVLLSDGTGNSAAKLFKTNVWRFYQAVDINPPPTDREPEQIAFYDEGVGTETLKPLALLGLGLGIGLAKNVRDLYTFLCRNYSSGDNIFMLGFSRGAFTVRVLGGMIARCGLVCANNEEELHEQVELAYSEYKRDVARRAVNGGRAKLAGLFLGDCQRAAKLKYLPLGGRIKQRFPKIAFIGVWDTVDAYGMPVDEIKIGIDRFIWPMTFGDRDLSPMVDRARQALSLDDERPSFRPVLWNEVEKDKKDKNGEPELVCEDRLTQIWFAGAHANVGGGYPDDGLSLVPMQWMMDEAHKQGLWFYDAKRIEFDNAANWHGKQYDSRSGLAGYYRYGPRDVDQLCKDTDHRVQIKVSKVHRSAVDRIERWEVAYAPVSFPSNYVVMTPKTDSSPDLVKRPPPKADVIPERVKDMEKTWDAVARKRYAYHATVWLTVGLVVPPLVSLYTGNTQGWFSSLLTMGGDWLRSWPWLGKPLHTVEPWISKAIGYLPSYVGGWSRPIFGWYQEHPLFFLIAASILAWLFVRKSALLQREVFNRADFAWRRVRDAAPLDEPRPLVVTNPLVHLLRTTGWVKAAYRFFATRIMPFVLAVAAGLIGLVVAVFYIPKFWRLARMRCKYRIHENPPDKGMEEPVYIERERCPVQPYKARRREPQPNPPTVERNEPPVRKSWWRFC